MKWNRDLLCVQEDKQIKKCKEGKGDLKTRSHLPKFPNFGKKSIQPVMVGHTFSPSTGKAEVGGSMSLRPAWCTEQVSGSSAEAIKDRKLLKIYLNEGGIS